VSSELRPSVIALAGPNGAGKSTLGPVLLRDTLAVSHFVNADVIAAGLSAFAPEKEAIAAGRIMLRRLHDLAAERETFAFETTLAGRTYAPWIRGLLRTGYDFHLVFLWLPSAELAIARVASRVARGGHSVPPQTVRRRYDSGLVNFFQLYRHLATSWRVFDASDSVRPIAAQDSGQPVRIFDACRWREVQASNPGRSHA
jgi:predicted ABC-type ATPase